MSFEKANLIAKATKSNTTKEVRYVSTVYKQSVSVNADEGLKVEDKDYDLNLVIPVHTFETFISGLMELKKDFDIACAYSKEPITHEYNSNNNEDILADKSYTFAHWDSIYNNVLFSYLNQFNAFIYLSEFGHYVNLYALPKKN